MNGHPDLVHFAAQGVHSTKYGAMLQTVLYRADMDTPCMNLAEQKKRHLQFRDKEHRDATKAVAKKPRRSLTTVLAAEFVQHIRAIACDLKGKSTGYILTSGADLRISRTAQYRTRKHRVPKRRVPKRDVPKRKCTQLKTRRMRNAERKTHNSNTPH